MLKMEGYVYVSIIGDVDDESYAIGATSFTYLAPRLYGAEVIFEY